MLYILALINDKLVIQDADQRRESKNSGNIIMLSKNFAACQWCYDEIVGRNIVDMEDMKTVSKRAMVQIYKT